jgi:hypothetical protein
MGPYSCIHAALSGVMRCCGTGIWQGGGRAGVVAAGVRASALGGPARRGAARRCRRAPQVALLLRDVRPVVPARRRGAGQAAAAHRRPAALRCPCPPPPPPRPQQLTRRNSTLLPAWSCADSAPKLGLGGSVSSPASISMPAVDGTSCSGAAAVSLRVTFGIALAAAPAPPRGPVRARAAPRELRPARWARGPRPGCGGRAGRPAARLRPAAAAPRRPGPTSRVRWERAEAPRRGPAPRTAGRGERLRSRGPEKRGGVGGGVRTILWVVDASVCSAPAAGRAKAAPAARRPRRPPAGRRARRRCAPPPPGRAPGATPPPCTVASAVYSALLAGGPARREGSRGGGKAGAGNFS